MPNEITIPRHESHHAVHDYEHPNSHNELPHRNSCGARDAADASGNIVALHEHRVGEREDHRREAHDCFKEIGATNHGSGVALEEDLPLRIERRNGKDANAGYERPRCNKPEHG